MFGYLLSVAITFIVTGTIVNILRNFTNFFKKTKKVELWVLVTLLSVFWFITIPVAVTVFILYLLKLIVDLLSKQVLKLLNRNKTL